MTVFPGTGPRTITSRRAYRTREAAEAEAGAFKSLCCDPDDMCALDAEAAKVSVIELELQDPEA